MYDILIRNGTIVDGSGMPCYRADVGIADGKIAAIGKLCENARETIDADAHLRADVALGIAESRTATSRMGGGCHRVRSGEDCAAAADARS